MGAFGQGAMGSPIQKHKVLMANDMQWVEGNLETLGMPHNYINQEDTTVLTLGDALVSPWSFTGLPSSRPQQVVVVKANVQFIMFPDAASRETFRESPRTEILMLNMPLAVIRGNAPFLSEARLNNFLEFWKGQFVPITSARIHYLATTSASLTVEADLLYVNRALLQSYVQA